MAQDFSSILGPTVTEIDKAMVSVQQSQQDLGKEIERLIAELELFTDIAEPPQLQSGLEKLQDAKERLLVSTKLMQKTSERVERIQHHVFNQQ